METEGFEMKCRFCKWDKIAGRWISECTNESCENYGEECIEKQGPESTWCDDKEEE